MTDNPTMTSSQNASLESSWWEDEEAEECYAESPLELSLETSGLLDSPSSSNDILPDQYVSSPVTPPSSLSLAGFYKSAVTHFWDRDALGLRALGKGAIGTVFGDDAAQATDQVLDAVIQNPAQALAQGAEALAPGSGEWVNQAEETAFAAAEGLMGGAGAFFDSPSAPSLGDFFATTANSSSYSFVNATRANSYSPSAAPWSDGFNEHTWDLSDPYASPYRFDTELNLWNAGKISPAPQPVIPSQNEVKSKTARKDATVVVAVPPRRHYAYSVAPMYVASDPFDMPVSLDIPVLESAVFFAPQEARTPEMELESKIASARLTGAVLSPPPPVSANVADFDRTVPSHHPIAPETVPLAATIVAKSSPAPALLNEPALTAVEPETGIFAPEIKFNTSAAIESNGESASNLYHADTDASSDIFAEGMSEAAERGETPILLVPSGAPRSIPLAEADGTVVLPNPPERAILRAASSRLARGIAEEDASFAPAVFFTAIVPSNFLISFPAFTRDYERFIFAAAWLLPRRSAERISESELASEQADVVDALTQRHESVANLDDMGSDRDGSQHKPDWSLLLNEHARIARLKTHRREREAATDDGDDSSFRPARDAFVM